MFSSIFAQQRGGLSQVGPVIWICGAMFELNFVYSKGMGVCFFKLITCTV